MVKNVKNPKRYWDTLVVKLMTIEIQNLAFHQKIGCFNSNSRWSLRVCIFSWVKSVDEEESREASMIAIVCGSFPWSHTTFIMCHLRTMFFTQTPTFKNFSTPKKGHPPCARNWSNQTRPSDRRKTNAKMLISPFEHEMQSINVRQCVVLYLLILPPIWTGSIKYLSSGY